VDNGSLYKHIDTEIPNPDRLRQLIILCAARSPLPAPREGKDPPSEPSEKGAKLLLGLKDNVLRLLAERKIDLNATSIDRLGSPANGSLDIRPNEQNLNNCARTTQFKDEIRMYVILGFLFFLIFYISIRTAEQSQRMTRGLMLREFTKKQ
jgi:kinetochore protein Mis13/DSN1